MGKTFAKYELLRKVGQGGMSDLHLARQALPDGGERQVVLKRLRPHVASDPHGRELFAHEARTAAQLQHPGICRIFDWGEEEGRPFLAMEYLEGQTLSQTWRRAVDLGRPLPPLLAATIVQRVAEVLAYAHAQHDERGKALEIVHRDVSPQNIFLTTTGEVKLLDFGIARSTRRMKETRPGFLLGKPGYLSPEQIVGQEATAQSDVFALGVVLHEHLTGKRLFQGQDDAHSHALTLHRPIPLPDGSPIVHALGEVALAALEREPERRLATAAAFAQRIDDVLASVSQRPGPEDLARYLESLHAAWADLPTRRVEGIFPPVAPPPSWTREPREAGPRPNGTRLLDMQVPRPSWRRTAFGSAVLAALLVATTAFALRHRVERNTPVMAEVPEAQPPSAERQAIDEPVVEAPAAVALPVVSPPAMAPARAPLAKTAAARRAQVRMGTPIPVGTGRLTLDTEPWTEILLGDRSLGTTPLVEVPLPAGHYHLRAVNRAARIDRTIETEIEPDRTVREKVRW